jgi:glucosamine--fructose-6-phosphate aminotransferase (isomerizing)
MFFVGRRYQLPIAYEWSLKLKEISYLHSEAFPTGELKHGNIALIDDKTPTVFFCPPDAISDDNNSSIHEVKARGWKILTIGSTPTLADWSLTVPETLDELYPMLTVIVSQLLAYYTADILGKDIDKPRNLAKSVTVR